MTHFLTRHQIPGILSFSRGKRIPKLFNYGGSIDLVKFLSYNEARCSRSIWSWTRGTHEESGTCNSEFRTTSEKKTGKFWHLIFGSESKSHPPPDSLSCQRVYRQKELFREQDSRLSDSPGYESVTGCHTVISAEPAELREPRPKPPPPYKLPKAVLTKKIMTQMESVPYNYENATHLEERCDSLKSFESKVSILPFEELRPPDRQRTRFSYEIRNSEKFFAHQNHHNDSVNSSMQLGAPNKIDDSSDSKKLKETKMKR